MAACALKISLNPHQNGVVSSRRCTYVSTTATLSNRRNSNPPFSSPIPTNHKKTNSNRFFKPVEIAKSNQVSVSDSHTFDVVIVGAGIIGLTIARHFLNESNLSVAVVDAAVPCSGATGAGQGYIWRVHKTPGSEKWDLSMRSHQLWEALAETIRDQGLDPTMALGWMKTGSMLVGTNAAECSVLRSKVEQLLHAGVGAEFLSRDGLLSEEPALNLGQDCGAAFVRDDCQLDARRSVAFIEKANRQFAAEGRYADFYNEPVTGLLRSESNGEIEAVQTSKSTLCSKKAVIIAAGCWSGSLMHDLMKNSEIEIDMPVKPRKGHLLVVENFKSFKLNHGLMEVGYVNHQSSLDSLNPGTGHDASTASVSMTATMDMSGRLVLGSSRQLVGFNTEIDESILDRIWDRAGQFFPTLKEVSLRDLSKSREARVGLRPYMPGGKPVIGAVPGLASMFLAAGHEGEGLSLALGTAEMIFNMVLGNPQEVNPAPFSLKALELSES